jgi:apolipoprotein N-acyltransferase
MAIVSCHSTGDRRLGDQVFRAGSLGGLWGGIAFVSYSLWWLPSALAADLQLYPSTLSLFFTWPTVLCAFLCFYL